MEAKRAVALFIAVTLSLGTAAFALATVVGGISITTQPPPTTPTMRLIR